MKVTDLMIGDWVNVTTINQPRKIAGTNDLLFHDDYTPIPLTEDILVKNGFDWDIISKFNAALMAYICGEIKCDNDWRTPRIRYIHQLQHLLRLCGIEKEIEL